MKNGKRKRNQHKKKHRLKELLKRLFNIAMLVLLFASVIPGAGLAEDKVADGTKDIAQGLAAVPNTVAETANESNIISGIITGTAKGFLTAVEGVCEGMYKILTFHRND
jgi:hypothetical protein